MTNFNTTVCYIAGEQFKNASSLGNTKRVILIGSLLMKVTCNDIQIRICIKLYSCTEHCYNQRNFQYYYYEQYYYE